MTRQALALVERFGKPGGSPVVYLHGTPGAPVEAALIACAAAEENIELLAIDRVQVAPGALGTDYVDALASVISALGDGTRLPVVGFSIGAALALRVAARLGAKAGPLVLASTAGPLDIPGAFDGMGAGARVFRSAQAAGRSLELTVWAQALLSRHAPGLLKRMLFAGAERSDRAFAAAPHGRALFSHVLGRAWADRGSGYRRDLLAYVEDWSDELPRVAAPVEMWHGRGDTWAPAAMAKAVAQRVTAVQLHLAYAGHYTTLVNSAPAMLAAARRMSSAEHR